MIKKFTFMAVLVIMISPITLRAQESPTKTEAEGTLMLQSKSYPLTRAVAFETVIDNEDAITVVLSRKAVPGEKVKEARENDKQGGKGFGNRRQRMFCRLSRRYAECLCRPRPDGDAVAR
jgi:hypothetical protein